MRAVRRRAIGCAAVVASGAVLVAGAGAAQAQIPDRPVLGRRRHQDRPDGRPALQLRRLAEQRRRTGGRSPRAVPEPDPELSGGPGSRFRGRQRHATTPACRLERLRALFAFLRSKGVTNIELFGHAGFPASNDIAGPAGLPGAARRVRPARRRLARRHERGPLGRARQRRKILGADYIGSGGVADPGIGTYAATLRSAEALNRLGKRSVEAGVGPMYIHNHTDEFDRKYVDDGVLKTAYRHPHGAHRPALRGRRARRLLVLGRVRRRDRHRAAAFINKPSHRAPDAARQGRHQHRGPRPRHRSRAGSPRTTGTGELDFRPIFAAAVNRVRYYHQEHDGGTLTDARHQPHQPQGHRPGRRSARCSRSRRPSPSVPASTPAASNVTPLLVQNTGDAPLTITNVTISRRAGDAERRRPTSRSSTRPARAPPLAAGNPTAGPAIPRGTCIVNVGFRPSKDDYTSVARLQFTSSSDNATESVLLVGRSTGDAIGTVGGNVPSLLQLTSQPGRQLRDLRPGLAHATTTRRSAAQRHDARPATRRCRSPTRARRPRATSSTARSRWPSPLQPSGRSAAANPRTAYAPLRRRPARR